MSPSSFCNCEMSVEEEGGTSGRHPESVKVAISDEEKAVYDRQIRLWGLEAQNRFKYLAFTKKREVLKLE